MINKKAILFDLDGTLLSMDQDQFVETYFKLLCKTIAPLGFNPKELIKVVWQGTKCMFSNKGPLTNEEVFFKYFCEVYGDDAIKYKSNFENFYQNEFNDAAKVCGKHEEAISLIKELKGKYRLILATNPVFPKTATLNRIKWAGLDKQDFEIITTYENYTSTKPNVEYYKEVLNKANLKPEECIMVGNDVDEDILPTNKIGMDNFLLMNDLINRSNTDLSEIRKGDFLDLRNYLLG